MKIFVTGAAGFIGFHLSSRLLERGTAVLGFDNMNPYYDPALKRARLKQLQATCPEVAAMKQSGRLQVVSQPIGDVQLLGDISTESF